MSNYVAALYEQSLSTDFNILPATVLTTVNVMHELLATVYVYLDAGLMTKLKF